MRQRTFHEGDRVVFAEEVRFSFGAVVAAGELATITGVERSARGQSVCLLRDADRESENGYWCASRVLRHAPEGA